MLECDESVTAVNDEQLNMEEKKKVISELLCALRSFGTVFYLSESTSSSHLSLSAVGQTSAAASSLPREQLQTSGEYANPNPAIKELNHNETLLMKINVLCFLYYLPKYFTRKGFKNLLIHPDVAG